MDNHNPIYSATSQISVSSLANQSIKTDNNQNDTTSAISSDQQESLDELEQNGIKFKDWGYKVDRLFEVAHRFYKRNESKAFHPSFDVRNQMNALILQARHGNYDDGKTSDPGALDLVGKSRRHQWMVLKGMSKTEAMSKFICTLDEICPLFKAYAEAVKISIDSQQHDSWKDSGMDEDQIKILKQDGAGSDEQLKAIHTSLCRQTYNQFKTYAQKQYPDDSTKQKYLISNLQEQYYRQYISQLHPEIENNSNDIENSNSSNNINETSAIITSLTSSLANGSETLSNEDDITKNVVEVMKSEEPVAENDKSFDISRGVDNLSIHNEILQAINLQSNSSACANTANLPVSNQNPNSSIESKKLSNHKDQSITSNNISAAISDISRQKSVENSFKRVESYQQTIGPKSIGKFESYPKPKPVQKSTSQISSPASFVINLFNPESNRKQEPPARTVPLPPQAPSDAPTNVISSAAQTQNNYKTPTLTPPPLEVVPSKQSSSYQSPVINHTKIVNSINPGIVPISKKNSPSPDNANSIQYDVDKENQQNQPTASATCESTQNVVDTWSCDDSSSGDASPLQHSITYEPLEPASIWTKKGVSEFKESLVDDKHGGTYLVKQGTLLTIQVPTYSDGKYIYWEFVTEDYDIGFGLDFVYESNLEKPLALKIYEETDEDEDEFDESELQGEENHHDLESAVQSNTSSNGTIARDAMLRKKAERFARAANTISIVPTYRRDSHEEVFVGRHRYPALGYYLLKFDNTYSVLRSKTIYFRVCYFI